MGYPNVIYGDYGDEKETGSVKACPMGTKMILPDGREFAYAKVSATAGVAGLVYVSMAPVAGHGNVAASGLVTAAQTVVVGQKTINVTAGATSAVTKDQYADGYMTMQAGTAGIGYVYRVAGNTAAATTIAFTVTLDDDDPIAATIACGTTAVGLRTNPFYNILARAAADAAVGPVVGVLPTAVSAGYYCWVQRKGVVAVLTGATALADGTQVVCSTAAAGAVVPLLGAATTAVTHQGIGYAMNTVTAGEIGTIFLTLA